MLEYGKSKWPRPQHKHASVFLQLPGVLCAAVSVHNSYNVPNWKPSIVVVALWFIIASCTVLWS